MQVYDAAPLQVNWDVLMQVYCAEQTQVYRAESMQVYCVIYLLSLFWPIGYHWQLRVSASAEFFKVSLPNPAGRKKGSKELRRVRYHRTLSRSRLTELLIARAVSKNLTGGLASDLQSLGIRHQAIFSS